MKRTDIERMISLADDRYIDEIFQDKITGRRRNIFVTFTAVAAALALVAGGIGYLVSTAGNADKITADDPAVSELVMVDYSLYFQNKDESAMEVEGDGGVLSEATGISCYFPDSESEYVRSVMPFDMSRYVYTDCRFAYNYNDDVIGIMLHANNRTEDMQENVKMLNVEVYERGELFPHVALGKIKSMKRFDVDVYGYDFDNTIGVIFASDGKEYLVSGNYISYDEIGLIMDSIIENGLWTEKFDLSKAEIEYGDISADITLEQANFIEPFAGYVPQIYKFGDMTLNFNKVSYSAGRDEANGIVPKWLYFTYYNGSDKDICLQYFTEAAGDEVQPLEKTVAIEDIELDKLSEFRDDGNNHTFTIDFGDFKVNVWTNNCNDNELLNCIIAMRIGANGILGNASREISLIEANNIVPFAGYVPQVENIGGMHLVSAYCVEASFNGAVEDNTIEFKYLQEETGKYITLYYTCGDAVPNSFFAETFTAEELENIEQQSELGDPNCGHYAFSLECGDFRINVKADCTHYEMEQCMSEINFRIYDNITLVEANNIAPYSGFVPQVEKVGDMKLGLVQYNGSNIVLDYSFQSENRFSYIGLTYTIDKDVPLNYSVMTIEQLLERDIVFERYDGDDGRYNYNFAVDCKGMYGRFYVCVDGEKCTTAELYDCILTLLMDKSSLAGDVNRSDFTPFGTLAEANKLEPFAGYVPTAKEIGDMKIYTGDGSEVMSADSEEYGRVLKICYQSEVTSGNVYGEYDFKAISTMYTEKKAYNIPEAPVISDEEAPIADLDKLKTDGIRQDGRVCYRFVIDCGTCYITVAADCLPEEMRDYLMAIALQKQYGQGYNEYPDGTYVTFAEAKYVEPFGVYVPAKESGVLKLKTGILNYYNGVGSRELHSMHLTFKDSFYKTLTLVYWKYNVIDFSAIPAENIIPIENIDWSTVNNFVNNNTTFMLDCGKVKILVSADCSTEQVWFYIEQIKSAAMLDAAKKDGKLITMDKVKELAKKGDDLTWSDFESYYGVDVGSGLYIMSYAIDGTDYSLAVGGGSLNEKPMYIRLGKGNGNYIDIRYDSIDDFLKEKPFISFEF